MKTSPMKTAAACLLVLFAAACTVPAKKTAGIKIEDDVSRIVKLPDGSTCIEPAGLEASRQAEGAVKLRALLEADAKAADVIEKSNEFKPKRDEVEAVYFDACRAYSKAAIKKDAFDKDRTVYYSLRQQLFAQDVKQWQEKKEGIADAGKLCLVQLPDADPDHRSFTRVIPPESTVGDCAQLAVANGATEILLGCTKGNWENTWAKSPIAIPGAGKLPQLAVGTSSHKPDPNCGWN